MFSANAHDYSSLFGVRVFESIMVPEREPKFSLKAGDYVSDECRRDFNRFLVEHFGYERSAIISKGAIFIHPNNIQYLEKILTKKRSEAVGSVDSTDLMPWKDRRDNAPAHPFYKQIIWGNFVS